jgi:CRISPR-associated protein Csb1
MSNSTITAPVSALLSEFGAFTIPEGCRRIFITAELEPSNSDPRIQPTGFPDIGPVLYPDPNPDVEKNNGLICLIDGEAKVGQFLEEVCLSDKYEGKWRDELAGLPYIKLTRDGKAEGEFVTATTIDGHRFASEYVMGAQFAEISADMKKAFDEQAAAAKAKEDEAGKKTTAKTPAKNPATAKPEFVLWVRHLLGMKSKDKCPASNVPRIFKVAMEYDPMALLHGFQISVKDKLTFVGLRSPRAITGSVIGLGCERIAVPGVRFDPIGTAAASQAIFQKQRISAKKIEARFCIDVGLLASMRLGEGEQSKARLELLLKIALCKVAWFIGEMQNGKRLRTECDLRLVKDGAKFWLNRIDGAGTTFPFSEIATAASGLGIANEALGFTKANAPLVLKHVTAKPKKEGDSADGETNSENEGSETEGGSEE